ncbi:hypothetical protein [Croceivirga thetidis]|uniref:Deoxyribose-phosphate aldolase n=1 Tax=Croceivirga thetidis TaxID=2721623 RepID=A0ABX1GSN5_9FLAO|nr:hypothetical protein [Croceivirga thetidis]NKI32051.1 hypothetical protein [Croceivirga thetidis]
MDKILYGDNQFFAVNHISDSKSREQAIRFQKDEAIFRTINYAVDEGVNTFMCTTHDRIARVCDHVRKNPEYYKDFKIYPCMPYAHKYANAVTELGIAGTIKQYMPDNIFGAAFKGGKSLLSKDYLGIMELLVDAELKMFKGIKTPVIWIQNVVTDLILGLGMTEVLVRFNDYVQKKYNAEAGFITMNMPLLIDELKKVGMDNPIICASINKANFRMSGGKELYEETLKHTTARVVAMQVMGGGAIPPQEALEYVCGLPNIESILFGASSKANIQNTVQTINKLKS